MGIVYTVNGFPTNINRPDQDVRYHDADIDALYANGAPSSEISFPDELKVLEVIMKSWTAVGGLFDNLLQPGVVVSPSVTSFVLETVAILRGDKTRRGLSFQDWALLLKPGEEQKVGKVELSEAVLASVKEVAGIPLDRLIQQWIITAGYEDLTGTMKIYVGDISA